ncbi:unnamed protein product, partial [Rotaria sordida]
ESNNGSNETTNDDSDTHVIIDQNDEKLSTSDDNSKEDEHLETNACITGKQRKNLHFPKLTGADWNVI